MFRDDSRWAQGALLVRLVKADELPAKDGTTSDPFCTFKLGKQKEQKSWVISSTLQPTWNQKFEWRNVSPAPPACCLDSRIVGCPCAMRRCRLWTFGHPPQAPVAWPPAFSVQQDTSANGSCESFE